MTITQRNGQHSSPFHEWIRNEPQLDSREFNISIQDNDLWIHRFSRRNERVTGRPLLEHIQLVEVKTFDADMPYAQRDTLQVIDTILRLSTTYNHRRRPIKIKDAREGRPGCYRSVRWLGVHLLQLSGARPDISNRILWDKKLVNLEMLVDLLRFDRDPDYPGKWLDTRRHHLPPIADLHPRLS